MPEELRLRIRAVNALKAGLASAAATLRSFGSTAAGVAHRIHSAFRAVGHGIRTAFRYAAIGMGAVLGAAALSVRAALQQEAANKKLEAVLKATGNASMVSAKDMQAYAAQLQDVTTYSDDTIINTMAILATFKNVKGDTFKRATAAILDMSTALGQDASSTAMQFGKALNDPIHGVMLLRRAGFALSDSQEKSIKALAESGKLYEAQAKILSMLEGQYGGMAQAARQTLGGALSFLRNQFDEVLEAVGFTIVDVFDLTGTFNRLGETFKAFAKTILESKAVQEWAAQAKSVVGSVMGLFEQVAMGGEVGKTALGNLGKLVSAAFKDAAFAAGEILAEYGPKVGKAIGQGFLDMMPGALKLAYKVSPIGLMSEYNKRVFGVGLTPRETGPRPAGGYTAEVLRNIQASITKPPPTAAGAALSGEPWQPAGIDAEFLAELATKTKAATNAAARANMGPLEAKAVDIGDVFNRIYGQNQPAQLGTEGNPMIVKPADPGDFYGGPTTEG